MVKIIPILQVLIGDMDFMKMDYIVQIPLQKSLDVSYES